MDNGLNLEDNNNKKMGASGNMNSARIATLQDRKKVIEETLAKHNDELRKLCVQEAELTGVMPVEYPLEPGESPPAFRRRIGTSFQLNQNLINNLNGEEEISNLELEMQVLAKMTEAALSLAKENNGNKTVRRKHMADYQQHKQRFNLIEEKLLFLKTKIQVVQQMKQSSPNINQPKQKKKPRPQDQDDAVSVSPADPFGKTILRHSLRSLQHSTSSGESFEPRLSYQSQQRMPYKTPDNSTESNNHPQYLRPEDVTVSGVYRLSLNGYKEYVNRQEIVPESIPQHQYSHSPNNSNIYKYSPQYLNPSHTLPHASRKSPQLYSNQFHPDYHKYNNNYPTNSLQRQSSPSASSGSSIKYYPLQASTNYKQYSSDHTIRNINPHQIQPHQQYEQDVMSSGTSGLGGYWKKAENGEMFWCYASNEVNQKDKKFGSLDRRKNKRIQKRVSPSVDPKSATLAAVPIYYEPPKTLISKSQQIVNRHRQDSRQLVRTQSLGSVGCQTVESICPSDESSCDSESLSYNDNSGNIRKHKQKEWYETSLDGPIVDMSRSQSTVPSLAPEDKYVHAPSPLASPISPVIPTPLTPTQFSPTSKLLEIPAETKPSPRVHQTDMEIFNNNLPRNGTIVQHAQWKPYHEETKPFEMSDFYKYSTKFKRSPQKVPREEANRSPSVGFRNLPSQQILNSLGELNEGDDEGLIQKGIYQPLQPMKCQALNASSNTSNSSLIGIGSPVLNSSRDLNHLAPNVAENFSAEMNAWYLMNREQQADNNNATLV